MAGLAPRASALAGRWYPSDPSGLARDIAAWLATAAPAERTPALLLVPHAGLAYSGPVAAHAYAQLTAQRPRRIVVIGQSHRYPTGIEFYEDDPIGTPLGAVPIDAEAAGALRACLRAYDHQPDTLRLEHAVEVQFPFIRYVAPDVPVVPIVITMGSPEIWRALAEGLETTGLVDGSVVAVSTDLYHGSDLDAAHRHGEAFARLLEAGDREALEAAWGRNEAQACSHGPVLIGLHLAKAQRRDWRVLRLGTSDDIVPGGDYVVGYAAAAA
ncbi:MAG: AmmeMemoRadiSam system protein B [Actinobacteria bacterium]|nr:AmmeMemoRadiSam system protein B [Actinomycetota bacterium]